MKKIIEEGEEKECLGVRKMKRRGGGVWKRRKEEKNIKFKMNFTFLAIYALKVLLFVASIT